MFVKIDRAFVRIIRARPWTGQAKLQDNAPHPNYREPRHTAHLASKTEADHISDVTY